MKVEIRQVDSSLASKVESFIRDTPANHATREPVEEALAGERQLLVALHDDKVVGTISVEGTQRHSDPNSIYIFGLFVSAESRGKGVAITLINETLAIAKSCGANRVELHVEEENHAAIRLYEKLGFELDGPCHTFDSENPNDRSGRLEPRVYCHFVKALL